MEAKKWNNLEKVVSTTALLTIKGGLRGYRAGIWEMVLMEMGQGRARAKLVGHQVGACRNQIYGIQAKSCMSLGPYGMHDNGSWTSKREYSWHFNHLGENCKMVFG